MGMALRTSPIHGCRAFVPGQSSAPPGWRCPSGRGERVQPCNADVMTPMLRNATDNKAPPADGVRREAVSVWQAVGVVGPGRQDPVLLLVDEDDAGSGQVAVGADPRRELALSDSAVGPVAVHDRAAGGCQGEV